ncbi:putative mitochondrial protein [Vitis vinifera]|uniref:Putative mitochondrial protein n=1 Tax=Vitis vinifera TaxID=29760 RepID=A0A438IB16_VITVI|nr:putative mitochondrial protein [Vitis vinifera]
MQSMGFGEKWTRWISWCISTASFSVLVNGTPAGFFNSSRGLRQGDPLSPYLFVIGMEALSRLILRALCGRGGGGGGFLSGYRVNGRSGDGALVSHLLFADDTLVFCEASEYQMVYLNWLLMWFEAISGLRINLDKSEILPIGRVENLEALALEVGCKVGRLPSSYLGIPLGANHNSVAVWDWVEERFRKRLAMWKRQFISKGGRITLIRSTLSTMPIYLMSLLRMPRVNLWRHVISRKFGEEEGGWYTREVREGFGVGFWKEIRKEGARLQNKVVFSVGNGRSVKFWKNNWYGNFALCNSFPSLYAFAYSKEAWVVELWDPSGEEGVRSPSFSRPFNDWEVERLLLTIQGRRLNPLLEDRMLWKETTNEIFSVKSLYNVLASRRVDQFPNSMIWSPCVPTKVSFFVYEASWGKVLTLDQLKKRSRILANRCFLCCEEEESIDHILIDCTRARVIWELLFALFGVTWVLPFSVRDTVIGWCGFNLGKKRRKVWKAAPLCLFWAVWKERNRIAFDNEEFSIHRLKNYFVCNLWSWTKSVVNEGASCIPPCMLLGQPQGAIF